LKVKHCLHFCFLHMARAPITCIISYLSSISAPKQVFYILFKQIFIYIFIQRQFNYEVCGGNTHGDFYFPALWDFIKFSAIHKNKQVNGSLHIRQTEANINLNHATIIFKRRNKEIRMPLKTFPFPFSKIT
jgi:hypothetical protein